MSLPRVGTRCEQCGEPVDTRARGVGEIVHGVRVNGSITLVERTRRWLCDLCVTRRKRGHKWTQLDLFEQ